MTQPSDADSSVARDAPGARDAAGAREPPDRDAVGAPEPRDRDAAGRARNARPRDGLGRPLARGDASGTPPGPDAPALPPAEALAEAQALLDAGRPFHAHEVLEAAWKAAPDSERDLWQGLAQLAVGLTHARRGNAAGAVTLLRRGAARVRRYAPGEPYGVDAAGVADAATALAARIEQGGLAAVGLESLTLRVLP